MNNMMFQFNVCEKTCSFGAMYLSSDLNLTNSIFEKNESNFYAALRFDSQSLSLEKVTFKGNISRIEDAAALSFGAG